MRTFAYLFLSLIILAAGSGCGKKMEEKALEKKIKSETGADADVDLEKNRVNIKGKSGDEEYELSAGEGTSLPENFPDDVFIYKPSKVQSSMKTTKGFSCVLQTDKKASEVAGKYKKEMASKGWTEKASMNMGGQNMLMYSKQERVANINIGVIDGKTSITLTTAKQ